MTANEIIDHLRDQSDAWRRRANKLFKTARKDREDLLDTRHSLAAMGDAYEIAADDLDALARTLTNHDGK